MSVFGKGFGRDPKRPPAPPLKASYQKSVNEWYNKSDVNIQRPDDFEERPDWFLNTKPQPLSRGSTAVPNSPSRFGEWKLVWRPKGDEAEGLSSSRPGSSAPRAEAVRTSGTKHSALTTQHSALGSQPSNRADYVKTASMKGILGNGKLESGLGSLTGPLKKDQLREEMKPLALGKKNQVEIEVVDPTKRGSARSHSLSARSLLSTARHSARLSAKDTGRSSGAESQRSALSTSRSASTAFTGLTSASSAAQQEEILKRIQGLEDALRAEKELRLKMQSLLETKC